jgi:hypothetical protein
MSTLKVNTVQHNTSGFNNVVQFTDGAGTQNGTLCRAWVNFNGTGTVAIRASFNVSSLQDISNGRYGVNFSSNLPSADYAVAATGCLIVNGDTRVYCISPIPSNYNTTSKFYVSPLDVNGNLTDSEFVMATVSYS